MKKKDSKIFQSVDDIKSTRRLLLGLIMLLTIAIVILAAAVVGKDTKIVVVPPEFNRELVISSNTANEHYKVRWAFASAAIAGNLSRRNVDFSLEQLNNMFTPYLRENVLPQIKREAHILKARDAKQSFVIEDAIYDPVKDLVWIYGTRTVDVRGNNSQNLAVPQRWTYEFRIAPFSGRPAITHFNSYKGLPKNRDVEYQIEPNPLLSEEIEEAVASN